MKVGPGDGLKVAVGERVGEGVLFLRTVAPTEEQSIGREKGTPARKATIRTESSAARRPSQLTSPFSEHGACAMPAASRIDAVASALVTLLSQLTSPCMLEAASPVRAAAVTAMTKARKSAAATRVRTISNR